MPENPKKSAEIKTCEPIRAIVYQIDVVDQETTDMEINARLSNRFSKSWYEALDLIRFK